MSAIIGMHDERSRVLMPPRATPIPASSLAPSDNSAFKCFSGSYIISICILAYLYLYLYLSRLYIRI